MRSKVHGVRRPRLDEELNGESTHRNLFGGNDLDNVVQPISLENTSLEERRREARKPLYLVRYE